MGSSGPLINSNPRSGVVEGQYSLSTGDGAQDSLADTEPSGEKQDTGCNLVGLSLGQCGDKLFQRLLEVLPLRSKTTGRGDSRAVFPLPSSRDVLIGLYPTLHNEELSWLQCVCISLNSMWGEELFSTAAVNEVQMGCLGYLVSQIREFCQMTTIVDEVDWTEMFKVRTVDYKGEEVKTARRFAWGNISPALPREIGVVPLTEVCEHGCKYFVDHVDDFVKPEHLWGDVRNPKVMVSDDDWGDVCKGLVGAGVCTWIEEHEIFHVHGYPLLNGMFGVTKDEFTESGTEIFRLIMNLVPFNQLSMPLSGDVDTLPSWGMMSPFFLQPSENLLISSEDVKCFFYVLGLPPQWSKYLAFNKPVPASALPEHLQGRSVYIASRVLPMGYLNSVSLAQHVHRVMVGKTQNLANLPHEELRKDRPMTNAASAWRVYLDNYDLLEKVEATQMVSAQGSLAPGVLALREQYERWNIPRNNKKSVVRSSLTEMQGATVNGTLGVAYPREVKLSRYFALAFDLAGRPSGTQKQWQVACGGLVYFTMFRRPLLGGLNRVWAHIESFEQNRKRVQATPMDCKAEILRLLGLLPLARMNFRWDMHPMVTCSDASTLGGGLCCSLRTTAMGTLVAQGALRGQSDSPEGPGVLCIGLFDGLGALRVALDLLGVKVLGYISVEKLPEAQRVVQSHFPEVHHYSNVEDITDDEVRSWSLRYSQCSLVLLGAGPPCQGVSGLNADRRGALKDSRSSLFVHVPRLRESVRKAFPWCPTYSLMESVSSMDSADRQHMSEAFGSDPTHCDAADITWCRRPRLYWMDWELVESESQWREQGAPGGPSVWRLTGSQPLEQVIQAGWEKVNVDNAFPTFTTSRPSERPGRKPAGIQQCTDEEIARWTQDKHRFPPYQYAWRNCVKNKWGEARLPNVNERELMLGFPLHYTRNCLPKAQNKDTKAMDCRLTLLGNTWSVQVVACLLSHLFSTLGFIGPISPQDIVNRCFAEHLSTFQQRLCRLPFNPPRTLGADCSYELACKLGNLVSIKGEDIMLLTPTTQLAKFHRLRATVPGRLWRWKTIAGWRWSSSREHINALELRAILTSLKWRVQHQQHRTVRFVHLTDSLVCLHSLTRGRSSSRKLRRTMSRINSLILVSGVQPVWGYIHTSQNPADKPSRWAQRVRTKFKNAKA
eukprot:Skav226749  [mRNA]  locus=scaffold3942:27571:31074:- [translate_table: standard]